MQRCIYVAGGGRWVRCHDDGSLAPLPGHGDQSLEQYRDSLEVHRDRNVVRLLEDNGGNMFDMDLAFREVHAHRHRFAMRVRHGGWIWVVWEVDDRLLADSKIEWTSSPELGPPPEFARAPFVHAPHPHPYRTWLA